MLLRTKRPTYGVTARLPPPLCANRKSDQVWVWEQLRTFIEELTMRFCLWWTS